MSEDLDFRNKAAGVRFIDLVEITDGSERGEAEEPDIDERQDLEWRLCEAESRRMAIGELLINETAAENKFHSRVKDERQELEWRLDEAESRHRAIRELHHLVLEHEPDVKTLINETAAENEFLHSRVKEFQQQVVELRKMRDNGDEEFSRQELRIEEKNKKLRDQLIEIRRMEKENEKLRRETEKMTSELEQLSLGENYREQIEKLRTAEQELKHNLKQLREVLRSKDEEIEKKNTTLIQKDNELEKYFNTIQDLRRDQRELQEQLSRRSEEHILAAQKTSTKRKPRDSSAEEDEKHKDEEHKDEEHKDEKPRTNINWRRCLTGLWSGVKVAVPVALCVLLLLAIVDSTAPVCNLPDPDCNLWNVALNLLQPHGELKYTHPY